MKSKILLVLLVVAHLAGSQPTDTLKRIDALFASYHNATPGVSVAISRNGNLLYSKAFGLADLEHTIPNTPETIFENGSVSKQFTAAAILLLVKEGKLSLQDDVRKYVPELPIYDRPITIQHLLNHTSGLKDWGVVFGVTGWPRTTRVYTQELSFDVVFRQKSLNFTPGSEYSYSNSNYVMLVLIIERITGKSFAEFTATHLFEPLGMKHTKWRSDFREVVANRAIAYSADKGTYLQNMPFENVHGPGGLLTTTSDLLRWNQLLETHELFGSEIAQLRIKKGILNDGSEISYAAGLTNGKVNGYPEISHSGATAGYRAWLAYYPITKLSVVLLSNDASFNPTRTGRDIAEIYLGKESTAEPKIPVFITLYETEAKAWVGFYRNTKVSEPRNALAIEYQDGTLMVNRSPAKALHKDTLYYNGIKLVRSDNAVQLFSQESITKFDRAASPAVNSKSMQQYSGTYHSDDANVTFKIEAKDGNLLIYRKPGDSITLKPTFRDGFQSEGNDVYEFRRDKKGKIIGFDVSLPRANRIPFKRIL
jgi:CubicO group peptidase (beta-lactamase class C family)